MPTRYKDPVCKSLHGLGCVMHSGLMLQGEKLGENTGLFLVDDPYSGIVASSAEELKIAQTLYPVWKQYIENEVHHESLRNKN